MTRCQTQTECHDCLRSLIDCRCQCGQQSRPFAASILSLLLAVILSGCFPLPPIPQPPEPDPVDPPTPVVDETAWLIVIEESSNRTDASIAVTDWLKSSENSHQFRVWDIDSSNAEPYREAANRIGLPAMFILQNGEAKGMKLPKTVDAMKAVID